MLSKKNRISRAQFERYMNCGGCILHTPHLAIRVCEKEQQLQTRLAIVISKKIEKRAVHRNKIRRRLYTIMRSLGRTSQTYIIFCKKNIQNISYTLLVKEIQNVLNLDMLKKADNKIQ